MQKNHKILFIIAILFIITLVAVARYSFLKNQMALNTNLPTIEFDSPRVVTVVEPLLSIDETPGWLNYTNTEIGFNFKYPNTWKVEGMFTKRICCLDILSTTTNAYSGRMLRSGVTWAQFQYQENELILSKEGYFKNLIKANTDTELGTLIDKSIYTSMNTLLNEHGLNIYKFKTKSQHTWYVIPQKSNFSEVLLIITQNSDEKFEEVLSTLQFT